MQERVYKKPTRDLDELKQRLVKVLADFEQTIVDRAIDQWRKRLQACAKTERMVMFLCKQKTSINC